MEDRAGALSPGLRSVAKGFSAAEGYNLRDLKAGNWTPAMKRKVSRYFHELQQLTAQEKVIVHTHSPARLRNAQAMGGHDPRYKFKVAFLPGSSGAQVQWTADNTPIVREKGYSKVPVEFNRRALARDPQREVNRVLDSKALRRAKRFGIMTGANVMLGGGIPDRIGLFGKIHKLMQAYDGRKPLPRGSGNRGDKPSAHHWNKWLFGVVGFEFARDPDKVAPKAFGVIERENAKLRKRRENARKREQRANKRKGR